MAFVRVAAKSFISRDVHFHFPHRLGQLRYCFCNVGARLRVNSVVRSGSGV